MWKEATGAYFNAQPQSLSTDTEERREYLSQDNCSLDGYSNWYLSNTNQKYLTLGRDNPSQESVSGPRLEARTSRKQSRFSNHHMTFSCKVQEAILSGSSKMKSLLT